MKQYFKNTFDALYTVLVGMRITFKHLFVPSVTIQYPEVKPQMPERARNRLFVNMDDCIGCDQCSRACPVNCITIETVKATPDDSPGETSQGKKKALWVTKFDIDIILCIKKSSKILLILAVLAAKYDFCVPYLARP